MLNNLFKFITLFLQLSFIFSQGVSISRKGKKFAILEENDANTLDVTSTDAPPLSTLPPPTTTTEDPFFTNDFDVFDDFEDAFDGIKLTLSMV